MSDCFLLFALAGVCVCMCVCKYACTDTLRKGLYINNACTLQINPSVVIQNITPFSDL